jgi:rSAM/selenodomain-associated transferase 2
MTHRSEPPNAANGPMTLSLAVVIPVRDEEPALPATLRSLQNQSHKADRLIVVDSGSRDRTCQVAGEFGAQVLVTRLAGRGNQIALGVSASAEDVVVVGHADMLFPAHALARIHRYLLDHPECPGGCLGHRFASDRRVFRVLEWFDARRARRGHAYGDQAQFFRRKVLESVGGFPAQPLFEDVELAARLRLLGPTAYLDIPVTVSARRFERLGILRTVWQNWRLRRAYRRGGPAVAPLLFDRYYRSRSGSVSHRQRSPGSDPDRNTLARADDDG